MITKSWTKIYFIKRFFFCVSPTAEEFCVVGGVCARATKLLRVRVFSSPRLCAFSSARSFCPEVTLLSLFFSCQTTLFCQGIAGVSGRNPFGRSGVQWAQCGGAGRPLWGECPLTLFFVVCTNFHAAAAAPLRERWKFWDIWHISHFPAVTLLIQRLAYSTGSSSDYCGASPLLLPGLSASFADFV